MDPQCGHDLHPVPSAREGLGSGGPDPPTQQPGRPTLAVSSHGSMHSGGAVGWGRMGCSVDSCWVQAGRCRDPVCGGEWVALQPGSPSLGPRTPTPPPPARERLPAAVSGNSWRLRSAGGQGEPAWGCGWEAPAEGAPAPGPVGGGSGQGGGRPAGSRPRGHAECSAAASRQQPGTMWFQSNCPKILLQHKPRATPSPATNQRPSYRINRFHIVGPGGREPGARTPVPGPPLPPPDPSCWG